MLRKKRLTVMAASILAVAMLGSALAQPINSPVVSKVSRGMSSALSAVARTALTAQAIQTYNSSLSHAQVTQAANNRIILTKDVKGALPGSITMQIDADPSNGAIVGGSWALVVSFIQDIDSHGEEHGEEADGAHGGEQLIEKGTLKGTITGGTVTKDANGAVVSVNSMQLNIDGGSLTFSGVASGNGIASATDLNDVSASGGSLTLTF